MKKLLLLSVILLAACNKQDEPSVEPTQATIIPYVKKHHAKSDPPAQLDFLQLIQVVISSFPNAQASYNGNATELRLLSKRIPSDSKFKTYENWYSIKITRNIDSENWSNFLVEIRDNQSYEQSKTDAFNACKDVWRNIDHRVPTVINELAGRINKYGKNSSSARAQHIIRYGYLFNLDASHFNDGYPVSCSISYNEK